MPLVNELENIEQKLSDLIMKTCKKDISASAESSNVVCHEDKSEPVEPEAKNKELVVVDRIDR